MHKLSQSIVLLIITAINLVSAQIPSDNVLAYYPFNGNANDESANSFDGTIIGATLVADRWGTANSAYYLDGNDYINTNISTEVGVTYSISAWGKPLSSNANKFIYRDSYWDGANRQNGISLTDSIFTAKLRTTTGTTGSDWHQTGNITRIPDNDWHHIVVTVNDVTKEMIAYFDGAWAGAVTFTGSQLNTAGRTWKFGLRDEAGQYFNGYIDDVRYYTDVLTSVEVQALYLEGPPLAPINLAATPGDAQIDVHWNPNVEADFFKYYVYGGTATAPTTLVDSTLGGDLNDTTATITGLSNGTTYYYRITAVDSSGNVSGYSNEVSETPVGLVAYYPFNGNATDESPNSNNGTPIGGVTLTVDRFGNASSAYSFDGVDDYIDLDSFDSFSETDFSITAWFNIANIGTGSQSTDWIINLPSGTLSLYPKDQTKIDSLVLQAIAFDERDGGGPVLYESASELLSRNSWYFTAFSVSGNSLKLFLDGILVDSVASASNANEYPSAMIGASGYVSTPQGNLNGLIDDIRIYNRALSAAEITALYEEGGWTGPSDVTPPAAPANLAATAGDQQIDLHWNTNVEADFLKYYVYGGTTTAPTSLVDSTTGGDLNDTTATIMGLSNGTTYYYRITAVDSSGNESAYSNEVSEIPVGLVAYYPFNGNATDESANTNDGTVNGATLAVDRFGNANSAYSFDGVDDYIKVASNTALDMNDQSFSISLFVEPDSTAPQIRGYLYRYGATGATGQTTHALLNYNERFFMSMISYDAETPYYAYSDTIGLVSDYKKWHHIVCVRDNTSGDISIYLDGILKEVVVAGSGPWNTLASPRALFIGAARDDAAYAVLGSIDDIHVYNRVLSAIEIDSLYHLNGWNPASVVSTTPTQNALNVAQNSTITVTFDQDMDGTTINASTMVVTGNYTGTIAGTYSTVGPTTTFTPTLPLKVGEQVSVTLTTVIKTTIGAPLTKAYFWSFTAEVTAGYGTFVTMLDSDVGTAPRSVLLVDLDGDSYLDIITGNQESDDLSVLLGGGDGTFSTQSQYGAGDGPISICSVDLDGNGTLDLVAVNENTDSVSVLLGIGDGTFVTRVTYLVGDFPRSISSADLDGDGNADVVTANTNSDNISVLLGNGDGTLSAQNTYLVGDSPIGIVIVDMNGDGVLDVSTANYLTNNVSVLLGNGDGSFASQSNYSAGTNPRSVCFGDLNGDGGQDLAIANTNSDNISVLLGNGDGTFAAQTTYATQDVPRSVFIADFDGDNVLDLVVSNEYSDNVSILLGSGDGTFGAQTTFVTGDGPHSVNVADFDGDGDLDLVTANWSANTVSVMLNGDTTPPAAPANLAAPAGDQQIDLHWNPNSEADFLKYYVYGGTTTAPTTLIDSTLGGDINDTTSTITGLSNGTTYYYRITAVDSNGNESAYSNEVSEIPVGLVAWYPFNDNANDESANSNDGTVNGAISTTDRFGNANSAYSFDGVDDNISIPHSSSQNIVFGLTLEAWFKANAIEQSFIVSKWGGAHSNESFYIALDPQNMPLAKINFTDLLEIRPVGTTPVPINEWHHMVLTYDGTIARLRLDKTVIDSIITNRPILSGTLPIVIGNDNASSLNFDGLIDDIRIYNRALSAAEITTLYQEGGWNPASVVSTTPTQNALNVAQGSAISATFDQDMDGTTINASTMVVTGNYTGTIAGTYSTVGPTTTFTPASGFKVGEQVSVTLTTDIKTTVGAPLMKAYSWSFTTEVLGGSGTFAAKVDYGVGDGPVGIAAADLNGDEIADIVTANRGASSNITVLMGSGDGTFQNATAYAAGTNPYGLTVSDLDSDGDIDAATANFNSNDVSVLLNNGDGTFAAAVNYSVGTAPYSVVSSDFDGDGDIDLAVPNRNSNDISILLNIGDATFASAVNYTVGTNPYSIAPSDLDADGIIDLAVANFGSGNISVLIGAGNGTFGASTTYASASGPHGIQISDFNGDSKNDIAVANSNADNISILLNDGTGAFVSAVLYTVGSAPGALSINDLNNDGISDIAVSNWNSNSVSVLLGIGDGTFAASTLLTTGTSPSAVMGADFTGSGAIDFAVTNDGSNTVSILLNADIVPPAAPINLAATPGAAQIDLHWNPNNEVDFLKYYIYGGTASAPTTLVDSTTGGDLNDTTATITGLSNGTTYYYRITAVDSSGNESVYSNEVSGTPSYFAKLTTGPISTDDSDASAGGAWGDYDGDGDLDLFVGNSSGDNNFLYKNNGDGTFTQDTGTPISGDGGISAGGVWGDYDNDGDLDLFVANNTNENNFLYENDGSGQFTKITSGSIVNDGGNSTTASWVDYDNDGDLDIYVINNGINFLYTNNGDRTFTKETTGILATDSGASGSGVWCDYDADGDLDVFVANSSGTNGLYSNGGDGSFTKIATGAIATDGGTSRTASWGDYDADGDFDLFVGNVNHQSDFLYENNGDGTFTKITTGMVVTNVSESTSSGWLDFDNDGDVDLFVINDDFEVHTLFRNDGGGLFIKITDEDIVTTTGDSKGGAFGDYDSDGDVDVFVANMEFGLNNLYLNNANKNWVNLHCTGTLSNKSAIGVTALIKATIQGQPVWQVRQITSQSGSRNQSSLNLEFGLGDATIIDSIRIEWPSGIVWDTTNVAVNQFLTITEQDPSGLVAYYPFNGNANDESGNANNGTVNGATLATDRFGNANSAYSFDGVDDYILGSNNFSGIDESSTSFWFSIDPANLILSQVVQTSVAQVRVDPIDDKIYVLIFDDRNGGTSSGPALGFVFQTDFQWQNNKWYHGILTVQSNDSIQVLIDNIEINMGTPANDVNISGDYNYTTVGTRLSTGGGAIYYTGLIDDIRIYNRALSGAEITALYEEGGWTGPSDVTPPAAPTNLAATPGDQRISLHWNPNAEADFLKYYIYGGTTTAPTTLVDSSTVGDLNDTTATITNLSNGTTYYYRITAVDDSGNESAYSSEVNAVPFNSAPVLTSSSTASATEDLPFVYQAIGTDADGATLSYTFDLMPHWTIAAGDSIFGTPLEGDLDTSFRVIASDGSLTDTLVVVLTVTQVNDAPVVTSPIVLDVVEWEYAAYHGLATDPEDSSLTWNFAGLPSWLASAADSVWGYPDEAATDTIFLAVVSDGDLTDTAQVVVTVTKLWPTITASITNNDFGFVPRDSTVTEVAMIYNTGQDTLIVNDMTFDLPAFALRETTFEVLLGDSHQVWIDFTPSGPVVYQDTLRIFSDDPNLPVVDFWVSGSGSKPTIMVDDDSVDFGSSMAHYDASTSLEIRNNGNANLHISSITCTEPAFTIISPTGSVDIDGGTVMSPGLDIRFTPPDTLDYSGWIIIASNDPDRLEDSVRVTGRGVMPIPRVKHRAKSVVAASGDTASFSLVLLNDGNYAYDFELTSEAEWLTYNWLMPRPTAGTVGAHSSLTVSIGTNDSRFMNQGNYWGVLIVDCWASGNVGIHSFEDSVKVHLNILPEQAVAFSNNTVLPGNSEPFEVTSGTGDPLGLTLDFNSPGGGTVTAMAANIPPPTSDSTVVVDPDGLIDDFTTASLYWEINTEMNGGFQADITFDYSLLIGVPQPGKLRLGRRAGFSGADVPWELIEISTTVIDTIPQTISAMGQSQFSQWTIIADPSENPLADVVGPVISAIATSLTTNPLTVTAEIVDESAIATTELYYAKGEQHQFTAVALTAGTDHEYSGNIPQAAVTHTGLVFFIKAVDELGHTNYSDTTQRVIVFTANTLSTAVEGSAFPTGLPKSTWRLFSAPAILEATDNASVLEDDFGTGASDETWQLFTYDGDYSTASELQSGQAYWIKQIVNDDVAIDLPAGGSADLRGISYTLAAHSWKFIATPYSFTTNLDVDDEVFYGPFTYGPFGSGGQEGWSTATISTPLAPFGGYVIYNLSDTEQTLTLDPRVGLPQLAKRIPAKIDGWRLEITAEGQRFFDGGNVIGRRSDASEGFDRFDHPEMPNLVEHLSLALHAEIEAEHPLVLNSDIRSEDVANGVWHLNLTSNGDPGDVALRANVSGELPPDNQVLLLDLSSREVYDLLTLLGPVTIERRNERFPARLEMIVGDAAFTEATVQDILANLPTEFALGKNYPNPFNPTTTIEYSLPRPAKVSLRIYDLLGKEVNTLLNEWQDMGYRQVQWHGSDHSGRSVASGIYFVVYKGEDVMSVRKMLLLK